MSGSKLSLALLLLLLLFLLYGLGTAAEANRRRQEEGEEEGGGYGGRTRRRGYYGGGDEEEEEEEWWRERREREREREREMDRRERERREWEREQRERERGKGKREEEEGEDYFLLGERERVFQTDAGEMKVVRSFGGGGKIVDKPMHIGFIAMEPQTLFIPQYLDSNLILFVHRGEAKLGLIYEDELLERHLKIGDIYRIPAGSAFYLVNVEEGQRLHIICSVDTSESLGLRNFQSFFLGGGTYPASVLKGFDLETLATAFNVTREEVGEFLTVQQEGPVVFIPETDVQTVWSNFLKLKDEDKLQHLKEIVDLHGGRSEVEEEKKEEEEKQGAWSWWSLFESIFRRDPKDDRKEREREREQQEREREREQRPLDPGGDQRGEREEQPYDPRGDRPGDPRGKREDQPYDPRGDRPGDPRGEREEQPYDPRGDRPGDPRGEREERPHDPRGEREERPHDPRGDRPGDRRGERRGERRGWKWRTGKGPDSYNLYDRKPDFRNNYGWSVALHGKDYEPLHHSGIGVYLVNLTAGSMMAPHVNPTATEYGVVLKGTGTIQIGYPNGTPAMNKKVREGDVFWVPRYFPFCQIASRSGPFEFFGFTTSAHRNRPQFLAGRSSVFQALRGPELATSFGFRNISDMADFLDAQRESVILPTSSAAPPEIMMEKLEDENGTARIRSAVKALGKEMIDGF